jgi:hypothetical protein
MADLLTRLAERALGIAPALRPVVPSLFAPENGAPADPGVEEQAVVRPPHNPPSVGSDEPDTVATAKSGEPSQPHRETDRGTAPPSMPLEERRVDVSSKAPNQAARTRLADIDALAPAGDTGRSVVLQPAAAPDRLAQPRPAELTSPNTSPLNAVRFVESIAAADREFPETPTDPAPAHVSSPLAAPVARPFQPAPYQIPELPSASPSPAIRITIGRVEVRAIMPASPAPASRPPAPPPTLSLADYLKQRNGGSR